MVSVRGGGADTAGFLLRILVQTLRLELESYVLEAEALADHRLDLGENAGPLVGDDDMGR